MRTKTAKNLVNCCSDEADDVYNGKVFPEIKRTIAEEYLDAGLNIHVHFGFGAEEYCACPEFYGVSHYL